MFDKLQNITKWKKAIMDPLLPPYLKRAVEQSIIPNNISFEKYIINEDCIKNCKPTSSDNKKASYSVVEIVGDLNYKYSCINYSSMPLWYYFAYPDVFLWTISKSGKEYFKKFIEPKLENSNFLDERGEVSLETVNFFVNEYLKVTGKKLECSI